MVPKMLMNTLLDRISDTYYSFTRLYTMKLVVADEIVYVKGLNKDEILQSEPSTLRGILRLCVNRNSVPISSISIKLIGKTADATFLKHLHIRRLTFNTARTILNDCYEYTTASGVLLKGSYIIPFQFLIDPSSPESITSSFGTRSYNLEVEIKDSLNEVTFGPIFRPILLIRSPGEASLLPSDCIISIGNWRDLLSYNICMDSKVCKIGDTIGISLTTQEIQSPGKSCIVRYAKVHFSQRLKCLSIPLSISSTYVNEQKECIMRYYFKTEDNSFGTLEKVWNVQIPKTLGFKAHPYNSNDTDDLSTSMKITHYLSVTIGVETTLINEDDSLNSESKTKEKAITDWTLNELSFKTQIYLLHPLVDLYSSPPAYLDTDSTLVDLESPNSNNLTKSSTWLCTSGKYEYEKPPKYKTMGA